MPIVAAPDTALAVLTPEQRPADTDMTAGYPDLLGRGDPTSSQTSRRLMATSDHRPES